MILKVLPYTASVSESTSTQPAQAEDTAGTAGVPITLSHARLTGYWPSGPLETICFPSMGMMKGQNHSLRALDKSLIFYESQFPSGNSEGSDRLCFWRLLSRFRKLGRAPAGGVACRRPPINRAVTVVRNSKSVLHKDPFFRRPLVRCTAASMWWV